MSLQMKGRTGRRNNQIGFQRLRLCLYGDASHPTHHLSLPTTAKRHAWYFVKKGHTDTL